MSEKSNINLSKVATSTSTGDLNAQNHRSWDADLLQELGKLWLNIGFIPLQPSLDFFGHQESDVEDKKNISIVFTDYREQDDLNKAIKMYEEMLKSKTIIIQMKDACFDKYKPMTATDNNLPVLLVQPSKNTQIRTSFCFTEKYENEYKISAERMCCELIPEYHDSKIILLLFGAADDGDDIAKEVLKLAKTKLKPKTYNVWGSRCEEIIKEFNVDDQIPITFGLSISSSNIETWSYINTDCYATYTELHNSLLNFQKSVKLRSQSLGLVVGPTELMNDANILRLQMEDHSLNSDDYMKIIKDVFPNVPLIGAFNYDCDNIYTSAPNSAGACSDIFVCGKLTSLLIISYD